MILTILLLFCGLIVLLALLRANTRLRRLSLPTWQEIAAEIQPIHTAGIRALALDYLSPQTPINRDHVEIWDFVGGVRGLTKMWENTEVLIALASYAQRWNNDDSVIVAERMRHDARALRRAIVGLGLGILCRYGRPRTLAYVHEAASSYHLMRERLLALYKTTHVGILPALEKVI